MLSKTESQRCFHNACLYTIHNFKELEFKCFYFQTFSSKLLEFLIVKFFKQTCIIEQSAW